MLSWLIKFFQKIILFIKNINFRRFSNFIKSVRRNGFKKAISRKVSLETNFKNNNLLKTIAIAVAVLTILFFASMVVINGKKEKAKITTLLQPVQEQIVTAKEQLDADPISSRNIILESIKVLEKLKEENKESRYINLIDNKLTETSEFYEDISGKKEFDELSIFYDLRLVKSDYIANDIDVRNGKLVLLDSEKKQIVNLDIATKKIDVKDFSSADQVRDIAIYDGTVFVLSDGIKTFELENDSEIADVRQLGDSNRHAIFINAYDRFVYALSPDKRNIYRYSEQDGSYSDPIGWMRSATGLKYNEITSFSVDGDIWLSTTDGQIKRFSGGKEESFDIRGLTDEFSSNIIVFTNGDLENIYVLEAEKNRIVVISKSGDFQKEIQSVSLKTVGFIAVSEELNKIFAVSGSIIFEIDLSQ